MTYLLSFQKNEDITDCGRIAEPIFSNPTWMEADVLLPVFSGEQVLTTVFKDGWSSGLWFMVWKVIHPKKHFLNVKLLSLL